MPVQRSLPRPSDVNTAILRGAPHKDQKNRALYEVCLILFRASLADGVPSCSLRLSLEYIRPYARDFTRAVNLYVHV